MKKNPAPTPKPTTPVFIDSEKCIGGVWYKTGETANLTDEQMLEHGFRLPSDAFRAPEGSETLTENDFNVRIKSSETPKKTPTPEAPKAVEKKDKE